MTKTFRSQSKALEAEWKEVLKSAGDQAGYMASFDCSANLEACKGLDVASFPAIRMYHRDGKIDRYRGPRKASS